MASCSSSPKVALFKSGKPTGNFLHDGAHVQGLSSPFVSHVSNPCSKSHLAFGLSIWPVSSGNSVSDVFMVEGSTPSHPNHQRHQRRRLPVRFRHGRGVWGGTGANSGRTFSAFFFPCSRAPTRGAHPLPSRRHFLHIASLLSEILLGTIPWPFRAYHPYLLPASPVASLPPSHSRLPPMEISPVRV